MGLAFAEDFLERPHLGEKHVARRAARIAVRPDVFGPEVITQQLVRLRAESFERHQMIKRALLVRPGGIAQLDELRFLPGEIVGKAVSLEAEIIRRPRP